MDNKALVKGDLVKVFHPGMFGVVKEAIVVTRGSKYVHVTFGNSPKVWRVPYQHVTEVSTDEHS